MPTVQHPIGSGFGARTTAEEVIDGRDLSRKIAIVTGGYSGLGLETTRLLTQAGVTVVVPARSAGKAQRNLADMPRVELAKLDLFDPVSIDAFARTFLEGGRSLDILVDCAGIMAPPLVRDSRGYESQFTVNHLGHFQLAVTLWPALLRAENARVISVTSRGHQIAGIDFDDPNFERRAYDRWVAYGQSKTANILFSVGLDRRGEAYGVRAFAPHPGSIETDLMRHLSEDDLKAMGIERASDGKIPIEKLASTFPDAKTVAEGAATIVWCATSAKLDAMGGVYCEDCDVGSLAPEEGRRVPGVKPSAIDSEAAERLWNISEQLTNIRLSP
jgi:NAD(P)-dependent dehydrogenase (short-subunit alcohol dehydrogenase family)